MKNIIDSGNKNPVNITGKVPEVLQISQAAYAGLTVTESKAVTSLEAEKETIIIAKWVEPDWSDSPLVKLEYPQMGYVEYVQGPSP